MGLTLNTCFEIIYRVGPTSIKSTRTTVRHISSIIIIIIKCINIISLFKNWQIIATIHTMFIRTWHIANQP